MDRINEIGDTPKGQEMLGRLQARNNWKQKGNTDRDIESYAKKHWIDNSGKRVYGGDLEKSYIDGNEKETNNIVKPLFKSVHDSIEKYKQRKNESKNMNKKLIRLTESDLHRIVKESVQKILRESIYDPYEGGDFYILYSPEVGFLENDTYESYEAAQEALMEYGNAYEDLTVYFVPEGDLSNAEEA